VPAARPRANRSSFASKQARVARASPVVCTQPGCGVGNRAAPQAFDRGTAGLRPSHSWASTEAQLALLERQRGAGGPPLRAGRRLHANKPVLREQAPSLVRKTWVAGRGTGRAVGSVDRGTAGVARAAAVPAGRSCANGLVVCMQTSLLREQAPLLLAKPGLRVGNRPRPWAPSTEEPLALLERQRCRRPALARTASSFACKQPVLREQAPSIGA
jgi:hypothetical protein